MYTFSRTDPIPSTRQRLWAGPIAVLAGEGRRAPGGCYDDVGEGAPHQSFRFAPAVPPCGTSRGTSDCVLTMLEHVLIGAGFAFAAAVQPGPLQAFYLNRVAAVGWRRTLPSALAPAISDGPIAGVVVVVLGQVGAGLETALRLTGAVVLLVFAATSVRAWRLWNGEEVQGAAGSAPATLLQAVMVNLVNPGPWLGWSLVLGPVFLSAWRGRPAEAVALVVAFYLTMVSTLAAFVVLVGTSSVLGPTARRHLLLASALALVALAAYQVVSVI